VCVCNGGGRAIENQPLMNLASAGDQAAGPGGSDRRWQAVIGGGKLGLLVAQLIAQQCKTPPVHFGRHQSKLDLVEGTQKLVVGAEEEVPDEQKQVRPPPSLKG